MTRRSGVLALVLLAVAIEGCASYYEVTEPVSGKEFYTQEVSRKITGSAIEFKDARTGAVTVLQNSQVLEVDEQTYKAGVAAAKAPTAAPTPASIAQ